MCVVVYKRDRVLFYVREKESVCVLLYIREIV